MDRLEPEPGVTDGDGTDRDRLSVAAEGAARHGIAAPRGQHVLPASRGGRFGRMFPFLPARDPGPAALDELVRGMQALSEHSNSGNNRNITAGYTYLGQFIDHDITFDPTSSFQRDNDPNALVNFRTPRFDLDSLYGSGPADQPYLYDWCSPASPGVKMLVATDPIGGASCDLPRNEHGRALVGDARNDENLIVSQLHLLFLRFHNKVVDVLRGPPEPLTGKELFDEAQRIVRWHYQWIVMHDFLPTIVGQQMAASVYPPTAVYPGVTGPVSARRLYHWRNEPAIPVEFSGAAFRFAHSMVRETYRLNGGPEVRIMADPQRPRKDHLGGFRWLPSTFEIEWDRFFFTTASATGKNRALLIDERLSPPLFELPLKFTQGEVPAAACTGQPPHAVPNTTQLARLNLHRGRALGLPSGQDVARAMGQEPLKPDDLFPAALLISDDATDALLRATPLWYYIAREASTVNQGRFLGPVGGRIVAEVLTGLLEGDPQSYLRQQPTWTPTLKAGSDDFTMLDLLEFTGPCSTNTPES